MTLKSHEPDHTHTHTHTHAFPISIFFFMYSIFYHAPVSFLLQLFALGAL
jgi:hypothetical protein